MIEYIELLPSSWLISSFERYVIVPNRGASVCTSVLAVHCLDYAESKCKVQHVTCAQNFCVSMYWKNARKTQTASGFWDHMSVELKKTLVFCYWSIIITILNGTRLGLLWSYNTEMNDPTCQVSAPESDQCPLAQRDALIDLLSAPCNRSLKHFQRGVFFLNWEEQKNQHRSFIYSFVTGLFANMPVWVSMKANRTFAKSLAKGWLISIVCLFVTDV